MQQFRHYSFDLWNTIIKPNPEYKRQRMRYFHIYCLKRGVLKDGEEIEQTFRDVWKYFDSVSQLFGKAPNCLEMYAMVIFRLTGSLKDLTPLNMEIMYQELEKIFLEHHPALYDADTLPVLEELQLRGKTLSLLSNTSFIRGNTLEKVLENLDVKHRFMFRLYSDQIGYSKPCRECFRLVDDKLPYDVEDVIHVGDNELADGAGAQEYGFGHVIINSNQFTIKDLL
jgi:putative hydrolase of the HAD superfamily